ncbi:unnamed protein product [Alopecurus aequalis]
MSVVYICLLVGVVLLATNATIGTIGVTNATAVRARVSPAAATAPSAPANNSDQYICYLCRQRNTLMIKWCPLDVDNCHIAWLSSPSSTASPRALSPPGHDVDDDSDMSVLGTGPGGANGDDCYVMKLYPDGRWIIVYAVSCQAVLGCYLACGDGDDARGNTTPAVARGPFLPQLDAKFQRCGDQITAAGAAVPGV